MNNVTASKSSNSEMASKIKTIFKSSFVKNCHATFDKKMKFNFHVFIFDDDYMFKNSPKRLTFVTRPFLIMLNLEVDKIYLQQL